MQATIWRYENRGATIAADELIQVGREIAAQLGQAQGFVSFLFLDSSPELQTWNPEPDQVLTIVSIFEDLASLEQAGRLFSTTLDKRLPAGCPEHFQLTQVTTGEIVFQRGL